MKKDNDQQSKTQVTAVAAGPAPPQPTKIGFTGQDIENAVASARKQFAPHFIAYYDNNIISEECSFEELAILQHYLPGEVSSDIKDHDKYPALYGCMLEVYGRMNRQLQQEQEQLQKQQEIIVEEEPEIIVEEEQQEIVAEEELELHDPKKKKTNQNLEGSEDNESDDNEADLESEISEKKDDVYQANYVNLNDPVQGTNQERTWHKTDIGLSEEEIDQNNYQFGNDPGNKKFHAYKHNQAQNPNYDQNQGTFDTENNNNYIENESELEKEYYFSQPDTTVPPEQQKYVNPSINPHGGLQNDN